MLIVQLLSPDVSAPEFDPEFINAIEVGAKNSIADGRLTANLSAFYYDDIIRRTQEGPLVGRFRSITVLEPRVFGFRLSYDY